MSLLMMLLSACTSVQPRAAASSVGCMRAVRAQLPTGLSDKRLHCLAAAQIVRQCSLAEAYLAGIGKELGDLFNAGDVEWADWRADRVGMQCGRAQDVVTIDDCCAAKGY